MGKILPILLAVIGLAAGGGAGFVLRPPPPEPDPAEMLEADEGHEEEKASDNAKDGLDEEGNDDPAFVKINNQFIVPVVDGKRVRALVVLSITLETNDAGSEQVYNMEPKLRDAFLSVMFDHAYAGGFDGAFTASPTLDALRFALLESARHIVGDIVVDVLITDIVRQDN